MSVEQVETLIVGGGQAGLAMSEQLSKRGLPHLVVERHRIAERWRAERWDGLHANGPAWHDRLSGLPIAGVDPDGFATRDQMVDYFVAYAERLAAPVRCGVTVTALHNNAGGIGFRAETSHGAIEATNVVAATGPFQRPIIPPLVPPAPVNQPPKTQIVQMHSNAYRNPGQLPPGAVLVVGAGSSGAQIADELSRAGRRVYLSVGQHQRPPRRYRGRDFGWWYRVQGLWDVPVSDPPARHVTIAVSGAYGGHTIDFRRLAARGVTLVGRTASFADGVMRFSPTSRTTLRMAMRPTWPCSTRPTPMPRGRASTCPRSQRHDWSNRTHPASPTPSDSEPPRRRDSRHRLGDRVRARFRLAGGRRLQRTRRASAPARRVRCAWAVFPGTALAVPPRVELHLRRGTRRGASGGPHCRARSSPPMNRRPPATMSSAG